MGRRRDARVVGRRGEPRAEFCKWLAARPEKRVAVAAHSAILLGLFNTVFAKSDPECKKWFGTGEMRTVKLTFTPK